MLCGRLLTMPAQIADDWPNSLQTLDAGAQRPLDDFPKVRKNVEGIFQIGLAAFDPGKRLSQTIEQSHFGYPEAERTQNDAHYVLCFSA